MDVVAAAATNLFVGSEEEPRQVVRVTVQADADDGDEPARVSVEGPRLGSVEAVAVGPLRPGDRAALEVGIRVADGVAPGGSLEAEVVVEGAGRSVRHPFEFEVAEPGWRLFMIAHFHYDPVWWNTQAAYTESWATAIRYRAGFQEPGLALVKAHLEMARRDADYKFVLAELDYLKPYWDVYPEDRTYIGRLLAEGRLELVGGTYNEPNTNLTSAESTIRNAIYGVGYQRDVLGGSPATAWQLDAFGHDPQFPGIMADASITSSSWARGPFHEWGPNWVRGPARMAIPQMATGDLPRMQFPTEFDWVSPSGGALLTSFMADHYSAGWWLESSPTLEQAESEIHRLFTELAALAATRNVLLPMGTDYSPPNRWQTAVQRDWNARHVWPKFLSAIPREFFDAVREEMASRGRRFTPQTRDMNPVYTGKDVSFIDTKQAQRLAENTLLAGEKFGVIASLLGGRYPVDASDKAWRQLLFGAHHDGITGSESDQVYLDLMGGWRESFELGRGILDGALDHLGSRIDSLGDGQAVTVFNPSSWPRTDVVRIAVPEAPGDRQVVDDAGAHVPAVIDDTGASFIARDVPALGYRTYRLVGATGAAGDDGWREVDGVAIENDVYAARADPDRGGALVSLVDKRTGKEIVRPGGAANELLEYREYPNHPLFGEGPWHLTPDGRFVGSADEAADVRVEVSPIGQRIVVERRFQGCGLEQVVTLWDGSERVDFTTRLHDYAGQDRLFRVRFPVAVEGGAPVSEVGNAVVGRGFGTPNVDVGEVPFTLDDPAYDWFALSATARVAITDPSTRAGDPYATSAIGVAEVIVPDDPSLDDAVRQLSIALVRTGVTSTVTRHDGHRYGVLHIDSNLPDVRIAIGGPSENRFVGELLAAVDQSYADEVQRQLDADGRARVWVPPASSSSRSEAFTDLRGVGELPVLVVVGDLAALTVDLADAVIEVAQPRGLTGDAGQVEDYTVAVLNRGIPGFNVERGGDLYLSLLRSCSGWPSGVWIDPPKRTAPDGSNFQFQHWSHSFEYALASAAGDWRAAQTVRIGHEYANPFIARVLEPHEGELPATASFLRVEPSSVVLTVLKPPGNARASQASDAGDLDDSVVLRLYESSGVPTEVTIRAHWPFGGAELTDLLEASPSPAEVRDGAIRLTLEPFQIATLRGRLEGVVRPSDAPAEIAPRVEPAQPVFADYWLHNKGAAPIGYQPVSVQIRPSRLDVDGAFKVPIVVASERTDAPVEGSVSIEVPPGWEAVPADRPCRLEPGAHVAFEADVTPAADAPAGRYFVAARIVDGGQSHEDVLAVDLRDGSAARTTDPTVRTTSLGLAIHRALLTSGLEGDGSTAADVDDAPLGDELLVEVLGRTISVAAGRRSSLSVSLRNCIAGEVHGEVQIISPYDTWDFIHPWSQGFSVGPGEDTIAEFDVAPPLGTTPGAWWALAKVMYFGRLQYTRAVEVRIAAPAATDAQDRMAATAGTPAGA
jgi:alpha-mannosidase